MKNYKFTKYQTIQIRLWHWTNAIIVFGLLGTVFLRKTFLNSKINAKLIETKLQNSGLNATPEVIKEIAINIRNQMWDWHFTLGFILSFLFLIRIIIIFYERRQNNNNNNNNNNSFLDIDWKMANVPTAAKKNAIYYNLVKTTYAFFYLVILFMISSGLLMYFKTSLSLTKEIIEPIKEIHEFMFWFFVLFTVSHISGVIKAENQNDPGLVSAMLNGGKK